MHYYCLHHGYQVDSQRFEDYCQKKNCCAYRSFGSQQDLDRFKEQKRKPRYQFQKEADRFYTRKQMRKVKLR